MNLDLLPAENLADMEVGLTVSSFAGWRPDTVPSRVVTFKPVEYRIVNGIPMSPAVVACYTDFSGDVNGYTTESGFHDPEAVDTEASFRWFPNDFTTTLWNPTSEAGLLDARAPVVTPFLTEVRSWDDVARYESWASAAQDRTWTTLYTNEVDTTFPVWSPFGDLDPELVSDYQYWRGDRYVVNPAVTIDAAAGLSMVWTPLNEVARVSLVVVLVPHSPPADSYTILSATDSIHVALNKDSTISLLVPGSEAQTLALTGRTKPNEPVVIGLSVSLDDSRQVMMSIVDEQVRTVSVTTDPTLADLSFDDLTWFISMFNDAIVDILEIDLYMGVADLETMLRLAMIFDRIYGVTLR